VMRRPPRPAGERPAQSCGIAGAFSTSARLRCRLWSG
jgi:hypothetical protein